MSEDKKETKSQFIQSHPHLFPSKPKRVNRIGGDFVKREMTRFVKWPRNVRLQRQRRILKMRLKVPAPINQFNNPIDTALAKKLFSFLMKYIPETKQQKKARLLEESMQESKDNKVVKSSSKPMVLKFGLKHVTQLVEEKKAKMVVIANDVDPIELVVWLPALCRRMGVPYCIVKNKSRLGYLVHQKNASCVAIVDVKKETQAEMKLLLESFSVLFTEHTASRKGGQIMGLKSQMATKKAAQQSIRHMKAQKK